MPVDQNKLNQAADQLEAAARQLRQHASQPMGAASSGGLLPPNITAILQVVQSVISTLLSL